MSNTLNTRPQTPARPHTPAQTALNSWEEELKGRVFLDVINEPDEHKLGWDAPLPGSTKTASLSEYYFAVMDAIHQETPGSTLFFLQVGGQLIILCLCVLKGCPGWCENFLRQTVPFNIPTDCWSPTTP